MRLKHALPYLILTGFFLLLVFTAFRGLAFPDEGYILSTGQRLFSGQTLYRDFDFVYTPLTAVLTYFSFKLFGISIFSERLLNLFFSLTTGYFLFRLGRQMTKKTFFQLIPLTIYLAWGPSHINFIWPGMLAINLALIGHSLLYKGMKVSREKATLIFFSGLFLSLVILTKPNYAVSLFLEFLVLVIVVKDFRQKIILFPLFLGIITPVIIFFISLLLTHSVISFWHNVYLNIIEQIVINESISTSLPFGSNLLITIFKLLFYFSPLLLSLLALSLIWNKEKRFLSLLLMVIFFYLLGFRPVSDYVHLSPLLALNGIPLLVILSSLSKKKSFQSSIIHVPFTNFSSQKYKTMVSLLLTTCYLLLTAVGVWSALFFGYYRWSPPLITQKTLITNPRVWIWTDAQTKNKIDTVTTLLSTYSRPNEVVFLNYYAPMIYFLTKRQNPTRYDYTGLPPEYQKSITETLEREKVQTIITFSLNENDRSVIGAYIREKFRVVARKDEYTVWKRK